LSHAAAALPPLQSQDLQADWVVVGAGIVGLATALRLREQGGDVLLIDRDAVAAQASRCNAGALAYSDILPLASPGIIRQAPRWLLDPLGPLSIPPRYAWQIAPWLWRFWRASQPQQLAASTKAQAALMRLSAQAMPRLLQTVGAQALLHSDGNLHLYESQAEWQVSLPGWQLRAEHGIDFEHLQSAAAIAAWQPGLSSAFVAATFVPGWQRIDDPLLLCQQLATEFVQRGGRLRRGHVQALMPGLAGVALRLADGRQVQAQGVVVAAGAWSHQLASTLGQQVPLETERGYNTTLPPGAFALRRQLTFGGHGFVVTAIAGGVRVGGAVELGGLKTPPNFRRALNMLNKARRFLPGLKTEGGTQWMGFRPSLPDSLPVIGPAPGQPRVLYAFGHGHLGLTQSAATAELIAALVQGPVSDFDLAPFSAARFERAA
jgi:D-amino-acid dehydrogenase